MTLLTVRYGESAVGNPTRRGRPAACWYLGNMYSAQCPSHQRFIDETYDVNRRSRQAGCHRQAVRADG
jgi:hypothetical protein